MPGFDWKPKKHWPRFPRQGRRLVDWSKIISVKVEAHVGATIGEWVVGVSTSASYRIELGYGQLIASTSPVSALLLGSQGAGGTETTAPAKISTGSFVNLVGSTTADISQIALGVRQHGYLQVKDANGNLQLGGNRWIGYDYENRPIRVITPDGYLSQYVYDFEGSRVRQTISIGTTTVSSSTYVGQIYELTGATTIQYISAGSMRVAMKTSAGNLFYFLSDHLGSTSLMVSAAQGIVRTNTYDPFGALYTTSGTQDSDYKYTGQRLDTQNGLYYYGARYYDPLLAQFITPDTLIQNPYDPQTLNRYAYARNNPIIYSDPDGHFFGIFIAIVVISAATNATVTAVNGGNASAIWTSTWHGAVQGAAFTAGSAVGGPVMGGMFAGATGGALSGGGLEGSFQGMVLGGLTAGISSKIPVPNNVYAAIAARVGSGAAIGGGVESLMGGNFAQGAIQGAMYSGISMAYQTAVTGIGQRMQAQAARSAQSLNVTPEIASVSVEINEYNQPPAYASNAADAAKLKLQLANESQLRELQAGQGVPIIGAGTAKTLNDAFSLSARYGGNPTDWSKVASRSYQSGHMRIETHAYQNSKTGQIVEYKTKIKFK